ncbi:MAG TPA: hypothetical protein VMN99_14905 [Anaerolineales bacterium]|nr:hypothetical protein [Anaerolineales bacterium]
MEEEKQEQMNMDAVDTDMAEEDVEREERVDERTHEDRTSTNMMKEELEHLFEEDEAGKFRSRWLSIQSRFVDDPRDSVTQADELVADVLKSVTMSFANKRISLEKQWKSGENASTEDLRVALKRYRSFFDGLLTLES